MNAVVVDIQDGFAAVLCDNGMVEKIPNNGYDIGQRIELPETSKTLPIEHHRGTKIVKRMCAVAAVFALVVCMVTGIAYATPYGTVSLDANGSIEYTINCFNYVIDVKALNEDGDAVLESIDNSILLNKKVDTAVSVTLEQNDSEESLDGELEVTISVDTCDESHSEKLEKQFNRMAKHDMTGNVHVVPFSSENASTDHERNGTAERKAKPDSGESVPDEEKTDVSVPNGNSSQTVEIGDEKLTDDKGNAPMDMDVDSGVPQSENAVETGNGIESRNVQETSPNSNIEPVQPSDNGGLETNDGADNAVAAVESNTGAAQNIGAPPEEQENSGNTTGNQIPEDTGVGLAGQANPTPMAEEGK